MNRYTFTAIVRFPDLGLNSTYQVSATAESEHLARRTIVLNALALGYQVVKLNLVACKTLNPKVK